MPTFVSTVNAIYGFHGQKPRVCRCCACLSPANHITTVLSRIGEISMQNKITGYRHHDPDHCLAPLSRLCVNLNDGHRGQHLCMQALLHAFLLPFNFQLQLLPSVDDGILLRLTIAACDCGYHNYACYACIQPTSKWLCAAKCEVSRSYDVRCMPTTCMLHYTMPSTAWHPPTQRSNVSATRLMSLFLFDLTAATPYRLS